MPDTEICHCGAEMSDVTDHCTYCGCEEYEGHCDEQAPTTETSVVFSVYVVDDKGHQYVHDAFYDQDRAVRSAEHVGGVVVKVTKQTTYERV